MKLIRLVLLAVVAPVCLFQGCDSTSNEELPNSGVSLCINLYEDCIEPIMHNRTKNAVTGNSCSQSGCHAPPIGQGGFFLFNPPSPTELITNNFPQVEARTLNNNLLLSKATGNSHGGGQQLTVGDLCYNAISEWASTPAPTDGSACMVAPATIPSCTIISNAVNPAILINACGL